MSDGQFLTEDEFDSRFTPIPNHLNPDATWSFNDGPGCLFDVVGEEFAFVQQQDPAKIWTLVDGLDDEMYLLSGLHFVNRVGYPVTVESAPEEECIEVLLPMSTD